MVEFSVLGYALTWWGLDGCRDPSIVLVGFSW